MPKVISEQVANVVTTEDAGTVSIEWLQNGEVRIDIYRVRKVTQDGNVLSVGASPDGNISRIIPVGGGETVDMDGRSVSISQVLQAVQVFHDKWAEQDAERIAKERIAQAENAEAELARAQLALENANRTAEARRKAIGK